MNRRLALSRLMIRRRALSRLMNRRLALSRLMEASVERRVMPGRGACRTLLLRGFPGSISGAPRSAD
jgi:hypothetical protein